MNAELQKYQWGMSGMRPDDSTLGAMWFYRGFDTDLELMRLATDQDELRAVIEIGDAEILRQAKELDEQCRINVALRAELAQTCNCRFEDDEQTMWCPMHLALRDDR
jgi:hypothetical protein